MKPLGSWPILSGLYINISQCLWRSSQEGLGLNLNARHEFSLGYLVSGIFCHNSRQRWFELGLRTGCSYRLPRVG